MAPASSEPRLTSTSYIVLGLIQAAGEATSYDLKRMAATMLGNFWTLPHAQLYAEPERLTEAGYLSQRRETEGRRRKHYKLTAAGRGALEAWLAESTEEMAELRDPGILKLFFGADPAMMASAQLPLHERNLARYEKLAKTLEATADAPEGVVLALRAGIGHEREWVRFWRRLGRDERP